MRCLILNLFGATVGFDFNMGNRFGGVRAFGVPQLTGQIGRTLHLDFSGGFLEFPRLSLPPWLRCCYGSFCCQQNGQPLPLPLLTASADILFFLRGDCRFRGFWIVEFISGIKLVALASRVAPPSGVIEFLPGTPQQCRRRDSSRCHLWLRGGGAFGQTSCHGGPTTFPSCSTYPGEKYVLPGRFPAIIFIPTVVHISVAGNPVAACLSARRGGGGGCWRSKSQ